MALQDLTRYSRLYNKLYPDPPSLPRVAVPRDGKYQIQWVCGAAFLVDPILPTLFQPEPEPRGLRCMQPGWWRQVDEAQGGKH